MARDVEPVVELDLEPGEYIVDFELHEAAWVDRARKTTDWAWRATVIHLAPGEGERFTFVGLDGRELAATIARTLETGGLEADGG